MHERSLVRTARIETSSGAMATEAAGVAMRVRRFTCPRRAVGMAPSEETPLRDSTLVVVRVPLEATCDICGERFRIERYNFRCDRCGSFQLSLRGGEELLLESVKMEDVEP